MSVKKGGSNANQKTWISKMETNQNADRRWIVEIVFSSIKRVLGEDLFSKKFSAQKVKAWLKIMLYKKLTIL
jgi:hypothetical protein